MSDASALVLMLIGMFVTWPISVLLIIAWNDANWKNEGLAKGCIEYFEDENGSIDWRWKQPVCKRAHVKPTPFPEDAIEED